ncbi:MAG: nickel-dependent lactate racemase [Methanosarcinaceae archaeon]|nr:nickel-dependent lactate racemase [Methanosarcinaceae archaeon]
MHTVSMPYGKTDIKVKIPAKNFIGELIPSNSDTVDCALTVSESVVSSQSLQSFLSSDDLILNALENPIGTPRLQDMLSPEKTIAIIVNDITRPTPSGYILPFILNELESVGIPDENINIFFALGLHRMQSEEESRQVLGNDIYKRYNCVQHEADSYPIKYFGTTSRNTPIEVFEDVVNCDFLIAIGEIGYHYYAGYSGGAKSILPGLSSKRSIVANHKLMIEKDSVSGNVESPVRLDLEEATNIVGLDFILNVVLDSNKNVIAAFAGDFIKAHRAGVAVVDEIYKVPAEYADAVIVSCGGYPNDINLYQANKALENATQIVNEGGDIILVAECIDGIGNKIYDKWNKECKTPDDAIERFKHEFEFGGHKAAKTAAAAKRFNLHIYSSLPDEEAIDAFFLPTHSIDETINDTISKNPDAKILSMPYGGQTLPQIKKNSEQNDEEQSDEDD